MTHLRAEAASRATFLHFFLNGFIVTAWTARIPGAAATLKVDNAQLGLLLLMVAVGSILSMSQADRLLARFGTRTTARGGNVVGVLGLVGLSAALGAQSPVWAGAALLVLGVGMGVWDVAMNVEGAHVEHELGRTVMPRYHAGFSVGTVAGAVLGAALAAASVPIAVGLIGAGLVSLVVVALVTPRFLDSGPALEPVPAGQGADPASAAAAATSAPAVKPRSPWTEPRTLLIGVVVMACSLTEGSAMDWVAKGAVDGIHVSESVAAMIFAVFVTAMTLTRWFGTGFVDRFGRVACLRVCLAASLLGLATYVLAPNGWVMAVGVFFWGVGAALGFPLGISAASDEPARAAARVSTVSMIAYTAFFLGPPLLGWLAEAWTIRHALAVIAVPILAALLLAGVTRAQREPASAS
ncbi:MFS transporter [Falsarthrobacter nasiphocae]|uniref:MFS family permease n=1 Tax=Falsarthrobacter nasiphocae TaxID=189863 RepID=A0AAE3YH54_9MICC|nr:MFS transporter [Falsarthrobacter nasiphocae]MDR6892100.1 MFS family permease [Falsarthrobacter nasiphocae]